MLSVLNRELGADFDLDAFEHVAFWDDENLWVDIRLRSLAGQVIEIARARDERRLRARRGDAHRDLDQVRPRGPRAESTPRPASRWPSWWTDPEGLFALRWLAASR